jgi:hypothetical protein
MRYVSFLIVLLSASTIFAAPRVNSGGGGWVCRKIDNGEVLWVKAADLTKVEFIQPGKLVEKEGDQWDLLAEQRAYIKRVLPKLDAILEKYPLNIRERLRPVPDALNFVPDAELRYKPPVSSCPEGVVSFVQLADTNMDGQVIYSSRVWGLPQFSNFQKAAILLHEEIYYALRQSFGDESSYRTRQIMGLVYAGMKDDPLRGGIDEVFKAKPRSRPGIFGFDNGPALFNVRLTCAVVLNGQNSLPWVPVVPGETTQMSVDGYLLKLTTSIIDGSPLSMEVTDEKTGFTSSLDGADIISVFNSVRRTVITLKRDSAQAMRFSCESSSPLDRDPL